MLNHWKENGFFNEDINQAAIIPLAGISLVSKDAKINNAVFELKPDSPIDEVIEEIKQIISSYVSKIECFSSQCKTNYRQYGKSGAYFYFIA